MALKKPDPAATSNGVAGGSRDGDEWVLYPTLMEWLTEERWDDGSSRLTSTLLIFCEQGAWKVCFNDRAADRNTFLAAGTFAGVLGLLEERLSAGTIEWKPKGGKPRGRR